MTVTELTKEIYDKYPNVWDKITEKYNELDIDECGFNAFFIEDHFFSIINYGSDQLTNLPFSMLYGLFDDFFEENGIDILIFKYLWDDDQVVWKDRGYQGKVFFNKNNEIIEWCDEYNRCKECKDQCDDKKSKTEAKYQAILKACEILEKQL